MTDPEQEPLTDGGQPLDPEHYDLLSNAGRCDICGQPIDMQDGGDTLSIHEFGVDDEVTEEYGVTDEEAIEEIASTLEQVADSGATYDLAETIREKGAIKVHDDCLVEKTEYDKITVPTEEVEELVDDE